jgi:plasmid stabilization system protein ParE
MRYSVRFHPAARREAIEIVASLSQSASPEAARRWFDSLEHAIESLSAMPRRHPRAREADRFPTVELRQVLVGPYRVVFVIRSRSVEVVHIRHAARLGLGETAGDLSSDP